MCVCVLFFSNGEKEYLDILSIGIIKSCLLELILVDRSERKEREREPEIDAERETEKAVMFAPWGEERPPVSRLLYRLPPILSPPLSLPPWFSLVTSLIFYLCLPHFFALPNSFCIPLILFPQQLLHVHTWRKNTNAYVHTNTQMAPSWTFSFKARSKTLKFYSNECLLLLLPRCGYLPWVHLTLCVLAERQNPSASMHVCVWVSVCYMHSRRRRADSRW